jgi:GAF domain-containing protein
MVGAACAQRRARIALDVGEEPVRFDNPLLPETRSEMALPLIVGGQVLGALDVQSRLAAAFAEEDVVVLQLVADQVAVAIQNARLFATTQEALEAEREAYGEISRRAWQEMVQGQIAHPGYTSDEAGLSPVEERAEGEGGGGNGDNRLSIPIRVRDRAIGLIDAEKAEGAETWTREEVTLLETLVEQLGIALESARLYHDTQRRAAQERLIGEVTARMRETLDVRAVLERAADEIYETMGLDKVVIRLSAEESAPSGKDDRSAGEREL